MQTKAVHSIGLENQLVEILIPWLSQGKLVTEVDQRVYSNRTNLLILIVLAADIEMHPGPRFQCRLCEIRLLNGQIVKSVFTYYVST